MSNSLDVLAQNRGALLLAEVAGWLHDMGKCDERFLAQVACDYTGLRNYDYKKAHSHRVQSHSLQLLNEGPVSLKVLVEDGKPGNISNTTMPWLVRTLGFCHAAAHTEKEEVYYLLQQRVADTRLSSSFGYELGPLAGLRAKLDSLPLEQLPDRAILLPKIREAFSGACGDTRRPINDVTLWDWSNIVAAMYKAALAAALLGNKEEPPAMHWRLLSVRLDGAAFSERALRIPDLLARQKLITDGFDRVRRLLEEEYPLGTEVYRDENGSVFIVPDIPELLDLKDGQQKKLSTLIRERFCAGTIDNDPSLSLGGEIIPFIEWDEAPWTRLMGDNAVHQKPLPIAEYLRNTSMLALSADVHTVKSWWESQKEVTCSVCQLRPQGWDASGKVDQKALERKVCSICERRREDRSKQWFNEDKMGRTIWIDEIADASGMLALIVGNFDLTHWLDGTMVFYPCGSEHAQAPSRIALRVRCVNTRLAKEQRVGIQNNTYIWTYFSKCLQSLNVLRGVPGRLKDDRLEITFPQNAAVRVIDVQRLPEEGYILTLESPPSGLVAGNSLLIHGQNFRVADDGVRIETASEGAVRLVENKTLHAKGLVVEETFKLWEMEEAHTPARLQRVWRSTRQFWKDCEDQLGNEDVVGKVGLRLRIKGSVPGGNKNNLGRYHTYEIKRGNIRLSVIYVEQDDDFVIIDNLRRVATLLEAPENCQKDEVAAAAFIKSQLEKEKSLPLEMPTGYGSANKPVGSLQIDNIEEEYIAYSPALAILKEPATFMALVPADKALRVVDAIKRRYEEEMGKIRSRLPLTVGVIFADSRTPLPAILDAGRRMLSQPAEDEEWEVKEIVPLPVSQSWPSEVKLTLEREQRSISMIVRTVMGDGQTRDEWYPYWRMAFPVVDAWVHICDLREGDKVYLTPSRFDFEFLDAAIRRFEVSYEAGKRRGENHPVRPYYLEELDSFKKLWGILADGLATSQIDNLVGLIEEKRREWKVGGDSETFKRIVSDILENAAWKSLPGEEQVKRPGKEQFEQLVQAALSGQLTDIVEFYSFLDEQSKAER